MNFQPARLWRDKYGFRKIVSFFSDQFAYQINRKNTTKNLLKNIDPFNIRLNDPNLITITTSIRNNFSFNKTNKIFGMDYIIQKNKTRILLAQGFDTRSLLQNGIRIRWNIHPNVTMINQSDVGNKSFDSEFFSSRDYNINFMTSHLKLQFQPGISFRLNLQYTLADEQNTLDDEHASKHDTGIEARYNILNKGSLTGKINYINIDYNQDPNSPVAYEMLQGLLPGHNGVWSVLFQRSITGGIELNLEYSGRVSAKEKIVHVGGIQIRWNF